MAREGGCARRGGDVAGEKRCGRGEGMLQGKGDVAREGGCARRGGVWHGRGDVNQ